MSTIYQINRGINRPVEFRGIRAQYIWWLGGELVLLLILFAILYIAGVNPYFCVVFTIAAGAFLLKWIHRMSRKYGEHGMMKKLAKRALPKLLKSRTRKVFLSLDKNTRYGKVAR